ncbi:DNA translocase FtsK [Rhodomicrobium sp. Az07]|uniref:FtsK/SpoIIIE family DNA translocase n=1 Tax=Rhodomicrobium sp. Az07 TaxID=2839034 RepID=UPI001BE53B0B|nr:DNA translocase FtsK [Rhodomicrobium sp. Az07]MBT3070721.1 DNA translocase FtsK [Rhodomicrobium sp. Az07]
MESRQRFLPKALAAELRRLPWRVLGFSLVAIAIAIWLALISWSYGDPSPSYATTSQPHNWLGHRGASVADAMMQAFGLASPFLVFPISVFGFRISGGHIPSRPRLRLSYWAAAGLLVPAFFAMFPTPKSWVLDTGLGGIAGDFAVALAAKATSAVAPSLLWPLLGLILLPAGGWCLLRACGLNSKVLPAAFQLGSEAPAKGKAKAKAKEEPLIDKAAAWAKRVSQQGSGALQAFAHPGDYWLARVRDETPPPAAPSPAPAKAPKKPAPKAVEPSPFSDWGSRPSPSFGGSEARHVEAEPDGLFDDVRIEPFFGARRGPVPSAGAMANGTPEDDGEPVSPIRRFTGKAMETAMSSAHRIIETSAAAAAAVKRQKPLIYVKPANDEPALRTDDDVLEHFTSALPPLSLLSPPAATSERPGAHDPMLMQRSSALMGVLGDFGVKGKMSGIYPGPVITLFELEPARGTKSSRVVGLADDIARSMSAVSARVAVVPGRDAIGIELPNPKREMVSLRGIIESNAFQDSQAALPLALGKSIGGEPIVVDLARMPHLLIAGTTGSGKSVGINTMILSLLYRLPPSQCNFIMIDPKMLELSVYDGIPHLLAPVVTDPKKAVAALKWTVKEMNSRYEKMSKLGVRNITSYNSKVAAAQLRGQPLKRVIQTGFDPVTDEPIEEEEIFDPVPMTYIVVVIDEMADLMMVAGKDIEFAVQRLSQMARAAGIHLIMATQRPSVDVVTGTIKANFPSRISFQVTSKIDSRTIIGEQGAEQLLGAGDMLYMAAGGRIIRAHGPFVSDEEVEHVAAHLKAQGFPNYRDDILEDPDAEDEAPRKGGGGDSGDLYASAVDIVLKDRKPTTSYLQRRLGIGYNRAASLIERMEQEGIVGSPGRTGRREILMEERHKAS